jgi:hypothetical protein
VIVLRARLTALVALGAISAVAGSGARLATASGTPTPTAGGGPRVVSNTADFVFAESLTFRLQAASEAPIVDVTLRYTIGGPSPVNRRVPTFVPGFTVSATEQEAVVRGEIPPASVIRWWWQVVDQDGRSVTTEPREMRYLDGHFEWQSREDPDVRVWWYDRDRAFADDLAADARDAVARIERLVGAPAGRRIDVVVYKNQEDMRPALVPRGSTYEERLATLGARVAPDILVLDAGTRPGDLSEVLAHELTHIVLHLRFARDDIDVATWLDEGLAMYNEGPLSDAEQAVLDQAIADDALISVRSLTSFPGEADLVTLAYAESRELVAFLIDRYGEAELRRLVDAIATGDVTTEEALRSVYGMDQLELYQAFRADRGLPPAATPAPGAAAARPYRRPARAPAAPCGTALLVLPALAVAWGARRWAGSVARRP